MKCGTKWWWSVRKNYISLLVRLLLLFFFLIFILFLLLQSAVDWRNARGGAASAGQTAWPMRELLGMAAKEKTAGVVCLRVSPGVTLAPLPSTLHLFLCLLSVLFFLLLIKLLNFFPWFFLFFVILLLLLLLRLPFCLVYFSSFFFPVSLFFLLFLLKLTIFLPISHLLLLWVPLRPHNILTSLNSNLNQPILPYFFSFLTLLHCSFSSFFWCELTSSSLRSYFSYSC